MVSGGGRTKWPSLAGCVRWQKGAQQSWFSFFQLSWSPESCHHHLDSCLGSFSPRTLCKDCPQPSSWLKATLPLDANGHPGAPSCAKWAIELALGSRAQAIPQVTPSFPASSTQVLLVPQWGSRENTCRGLFSCFLLSSLSLFRATRGAACSSLVFRHNGHPKAEATGPVGHRLDLQNYVPK